MFSRRIIEKILGYKDTYRAIALIGPRQSGKTTLSKAVFPEYEYFSLENPTIRIRVAEDPVGFLRSIRTSCILDEIQHAPELFSYLQEILDDKRDPRRFILTGSNSFQLNEKISQSLAGRIRILTILPLVRQELPEQLKPRSIEESLWKGGYPRIYDEGLNPTEWYGDYYNTYVQKDVRSVIEIENLTLFDRFIRVCAGRAGQLCNYSSVASEVGVSQPTASKWSSILEASFLVFRLEPHFKNFNKRITKSPKLYFYDTGLVCFLLRITSPEQLLYHPLRGEIFENWVVAEVLKHFRNQGKEPPLYFWRDQHEHEIDLVVDRSTILHPIEIKSGATFKPEWLKNVSWFNKLQDYTESTLIYGGDQSYDFKQCSVTSWKNLESSVSW